MESTQHDKLLWFPLHMKLCHAHPRAVGVDKEECRMGVDNQEQAACQRLKDALIKTPVLHYFDPSRPTEINVDASPVGLAAILTQIAANGERYTVQLMPAES